MRSFAEITILDNRWNFPSGALQKSWEISTNLAEYLGTQYLSLHLPWALSSPPCFAVHYAKAVWLFESHFILAAAVLLLRMKLFPRISFLAGKHPPF